MAGGSSQNQFSEPPRRGKFSEPPRRGKFIDHSFNEIGAFHFHYWIVDGTKYYISVAVTRALTQGTALACINYLRIIGFTPMNDPDKNSYSSGWKWCDVVKHGTPPNQSNFLLEVQQRLRARSMSEEIVCDVNTPVNFVLSNTSLPEHPIEYVSPAFLAMTGYTLEEVIGSNCRFLQGSDTDPNEISILSEAISKKKGCRVLLKNYTKQGLSFWNLLTVEPMIGSQGQPDKTIAYQQCLNGKEAAAMRLNLTVQRGHTNTIAQLTCFKDPGSVQCIKCQQLVPEGELVSHAQDCLLSSSNSRRL